MLSVRRIVPRAVGQLEHRTVGVATDGRGATVVAAYELERLFHERARGEVTRMNQEIDVLGLHLALDGGGRRCVAVNVREQRDPPGLHSSVKFFQ